MTTEELVQFRRELSLKNTSRLRSIYLDNKNDCKAVLLSKNLCDYAGFEDIYTDAILVLHNNVLTGDLKELNSIKKYLIGVCINLCRKRNYYESRIQKKVEEIRLQLTPYNDYSIEEGAFKDDLRRISNEALQSLSDKCQEIIISFYLYGMSMTEIAKLLNLSNRDVAKTLKSRCFKTLMEKVKKLMKGI